ncbi:hypothetical protein EYC80_009628 [Monilinia laxa]|uniref:Uncharacterized protein n=1 Tax=Monilinia laxa TaxID=61186 RepID=A0A5N6JYG8_MONLA|nr:hypothetical protein EYC80_009628 [Monilinia laxa]
MYAVYVAHGARVCPLSVCGALLFGLVGGVDGRGFGLVDVVDVGGGMLLLVEGIAPVVDFAFAHGAVVDGMPWIGGVLAQGAVVRGMS